MRLLRAREVSAVEVAQACLERIQERDSQVRAWVHVENEKVLAQAAEVDRKLRLDLPVGILAGVPIGIKDIFNTRDFPTQMGSPIWKDFTPGNDARVVHSLKMADGVIAGKTVTAEFAVHTPGPTRNPLNLEYAPGTSSSGSAAAVADGMVPLALGTQTAGSIIRPASYVGIYGFKPSFGVVPRTGMLKTTDTLDTVGCFAREVEDLRLMFDVIRVHGLDYPLAHAAYQDTARQNKGNRPWRVAFYRGPKWDDAEEYARTAFENFSRQISQNSDVEVVETKLPTLLQEAHSTHSTIYDRALAYYFKEEFKRHELVSPLMYQIIDRGNRISLEQYTAALEKQNQMRQAMEVFFSECDIVLTLSTGGQALHGLQSPDRPDNCLIWTLCGLPVVNVPVFTGPDDLPFGLQVVARRYNDYLALNFAQWLQTQWGDGKTF